MEATTSVVLTTVQGETLSTTTLLVSQTLLIIVVTVLQFVFYLVSANIYSMYSSPKCSTAQRAGLSASIYIYIYRYISFRNMKPYENANLKTI